MIDKILCDIIDREVPEKEVALLLSGGADSTSLGFAAQRLGKRVTAYTFHVDDVHSYDSKKACETAKHFGWNIVDVSVPSNDIETDFIRLAQEYDCKKKTQFECTFPFLYVYPKITEHFVLSGIAADGHYGVSKKACMHFKEPKSLFDQFREEYFSQKNPAGLLQQHILSEKHGIKFVAPYLDSDVVNWFRQYDWYELNKPFQKHHVRESFSEFAQIKIKNHLNLQLGADIDELFEREVLSNTKLNYNNRKRVMDVCRDWSEKTTTLEDFFT